MNICIQDRIYVNPFLLSICVLNRNGFVSLYQNNTAERWKAPKELVIRFPNSEGQTHQQRIPLFMLVILLKYIITRIVYMRPRFPAANGTIKWFAQIHFVLLDSSILLSWVLEFRLFDPSHYNRRSRMQYKFVMHSTLRNFLVKLKSERHKGYFFYLSVSHHGLLTPHTAASTVDSLHGLWVFLELWRRHRAGRLQFHFYDTICVLWAATIKKAGTKVPM